MDNEVKAMFRTILDRFDSLENEVREFRADMKDQIKGLDGKMDLIYHKLKSDIQCLTPDIKSKYKVIKEE